MKFVPIVLPARFLTKLGKTRQKQQFCQRSVGFPTQPHSRPPATPRTLCAGLPRAGCAHKAALQRTGAAADATGADRQRQLGSGLLLPCPPHAGGTRGSRGCSTALQPRERVQEPFLGENYPQQPPDSPQCSCANKPAANIPTTECQVGQKQTGHSH